MLGESSQRPSKLTWADSTSSAREFSPINENPSGFDLRILWVHVNVQQPWSLQMLETMASVGTD
jgi:hypothetical protein